MKLAGRCTDLIRFYSILDELEAAIGGARKLAECSGRMVWPGRGVYFFARRTSTAATQAKAREWSASGRTLHKIERVRNQSALIDKLGKRIHSRNTCRPDQMSDQGAVPVALIDIEPRSRTLLRFQQYPM